MINYSFGIIVPSFATFVALAQTTLIILPRFNPKGNYSTESLFYLEINAAKPFQLSKSLLFVLLYNYKSYSCNLPPLIAVGGFLVRVEKQFLKSKIL